MANLFENLSWCEKMRINFDFNNMMAKFVGDEYGICEDEINMMEENIFKIIYDFKNNRKGFMNLPYDTEQIKEISNYSKKIEGKFENILVLGIGGSSLGGISLISSLKSQNYNFIPSKTRKTPRIFFYDNVDPDELNDLLNICDLKKTLVNVITKSGSTVETMSAFLIIKEKLKNLLGEKYTKNLVITTDKEKGELLKIAKNENLTSFVIPAEVGGRFSVFSPVGLIPASLVGIDIESLLAGARYMDNICMGSSIWKNPAAVSAILQYTAFAYKKMNIVVVMPYANRLKDIADWYRQLWAESIGKKYSKDGKIVITGSTPIKALGVTDQHSQLQLYIEGPYDKIILFIHVNKFKTEIKIPKEKSKELKYLGGHSLNELINTEWQSTEYALQNEKRPNATIHMPEINEFTIGQLLYFFEMQTAIAGELFKVNTYDQPGVEASKEFTYGLFNRSGYENKKKEFAEKPKKNKQYII